MRNDTFEDLKDQFWQTYDIFKAIKFQIKNKTLLDSTETHRPFKTNFQSGVCSGLTYRVYEEDCDQSRLTFTFVVGTNG